jgi:hypothetical protein
MSKRPTEGHEPQREGSIRPAATDKKTRGALRKGLRVVAWVAGGGLALAAVGALALGYVSYRAISIHPGLTGVGTTETSPIAIALGGRRFEIPANYFFGPPEPGPNQRDILLLALWPTMEGRTSENYEHFRVGDHGRKIQPKSGGWLWFEAAGGRGFQPVGAACGGGSHRHEPGCRP